MTNAKIHHPHRRRDPLPMVNVDTNMIIPKQLMKVVLSSTKDDFTAFVKGDGSR